MEEVKFDVHEDFENGLSERFSQFINSLNAPCVITIDIESCGGRCKVLESMESLIALKKAEGYVFNTHVETYAYSCGFFLFLLGDVRTCSDYADFFFHAGGYDIGFARLTSRDLNEMAQELAPFDAMVDRVLAEHTSVTPEIKDFLLRNETFLSKQDMVNFGFMLAEYELI